MNFQTIECPKKDHEPTVILMAKGPYGMLFDGFIKYGCRCVVDTMLETLFKEKPKRAKKK